MSNKRLAILAVVAAVAVVWAVFQSRLSKRPEAELSGPTYLIQGLDPAAIDSIVIGKGKDAVTLKRSGTNFLLVNKDNYPSDAKQINDLITKCLDIQISQLYTDSPKNHEDLEVTEEKARIVIKFLKPDSSLLTGLIIGKSPENSQGGFVRLVSSDKVYLASNVPWFRSSALEYVEQELISLKREDIQSVKVTSPGGAYLLKADPNADDVTLDNLPAGKKLKTSEAKSVLTSLTSLTFNDVKKQSNETVRLTFDRQYVCTLKDSTIYTLGIAKRDDKWFVTCQADYPDRTPVTINPKEVMPESELKKKEAKLLAQEKAQRFALKHTGWVYEIADWKAKYLTKELSELFEEEKLVPAEQAGAVKESEKKEPEKKEPAEPAASQLDSPKSGVQKQTTTEPNAAGGSKP